MLELWVNMARDQPCLTVCFQLTFESLGVSCAALAIFPLLLLLVQGRVVCPDQDSKQRSWHHCGAGMFDGQRDTLQGSVPSEIDPDPLIPSWIEDQAKQNPPSHLRPHLTFRECMPEGRNKPSSI